MVIVITGPISSGKTTLAGGLATSLGAVHLSSDAIRMELSGSAAGKVKQVWPVMQQRMEEALTKGLPVILDATPMSPNFREIVEGARKQGYCTIIGLKVGPTEWAAREQMRTDRTEPDGKGGVKVLMKDPQSVYERSSSAYMPHYDYVIDTTGKTPNDVLKEALSFLSKRNAWNTVVNIAREVIG